jgi:hypothetical protein
LTKRKICVVVTARPAIRASAPLSRPFSEHPDLELQLVVAASALLDRYGNAIQAIERDGFAIAQRVYMVLEGEKPRDLREVNRHRLSELATVFDNSQAGRGRHDRGSVRDAGHRRRGVVHEHSGGARAGRRSDRIDRREGPPRVTKLANLHLVSTKLAAERVAAWRGAGR